MSSENRFAKSTHRVCRKIEIKDQGLNHELLRCAQGVERRRCSVRTGFGLNLEKNRGPRRFDEAMQTRAGNLKKLGKL